MSLFEEYFGTPVRDDGVNIFAQGYEDRFSSFLVTGYNSQIATDEVTMASWLDG